MLNSGYSYHMTLYRNSFTTYQIAYSNRVLMKNNIACKAIGIETVRIWMHNEVMRTLTDIWHVSKLKKDLISLRTLDDIGCKYIAKGGLLKISRGAITVMKGKKVNSLYHLPGETMTGIVVISSGESYTDLT